MGRFGARFLNWSFPVVVVLSTTAPFWILTGTMRGGDQDGDGIPDRMERVLGASTLKIDTDGDGSSDLREWLGRSNPLSSRSIPGSRRPSIRGFAWQDSPASPIQICVALYPKALLPSFHVFLGSPNLSGKNSTYNIQEITGEIRPVVVEIDDSDVLTFFLPASYDLPSLSPISIGVVAGTKRDGTVVVDRFCLLDKPEDFGEMLLENLISLPSGSPIAAASLNSMGRTAPDGPGDSGPKRDDEPSYCAVEFSDGTPVGLAAIQFSVVSADCAPDGLLYCIRSDCQSLLGKTFTMIDYGYLQGKASD